MPEDSGAPDEAVGDEEEGVFVDVEEGVVVDVVVVAATSMGGCCEHEASRNGTASHPTTTERRTGPR